MYLASNSALVKRALACLEPQTHRMAEVGKDLWSHLVQPQLCRPTYSRVQRPNTAEELMHQVTKERKDGQLGCDGLHGITLEAGMYFHLLNKH